MKIFTENSTPYLHNEYHFQSLCLLYFPEEKFPENDTSPVSVKFTLSEEGDNIKATAFIDCPYGKSYGASQSADIVFTVSTTDEDIAAAVTGKAFVKAGEALFGFTPPWGYLTGLRPVKRARFYLERGWHEESVRRLFTNDYDVSEEKTSLSVNTAKAEIKMIRSLTPKMCGIYISVPFCPTRCDYCSFVSYSNARLFKLIPDYLVRLQKDIVRTGKIVRELGFVPIAVYIGGGTPSFLSCEQLISLFNTIKENIPLDAVREFSFEGGRPDTITEEKANILREGGVDRISVNSQTTCPQVLENIGRKHTVEQFFRASEIAMKAGFTTVNTDLIAGLPGDTFETFSKTLSDVIGIGFENITVHTLSIKNAAEMSNSLSSFDPVGKLARECVSYAGNELTSHGYFPYYLYRQKRTVGNGENTGFSINGHESIYNVMMMEESSTVFACGAGAITKVVSADTEHIERIAFPKYPFEYLETEESIGEEKIRKFFG